MPGRIADLPLLVILMGITGVVMYLPAIHGLVLRDYAEARPFLYGATILLALTVMVALATINRPLRESARGQLWGLLGAYLVLPVLLALPFHQAVRDTTLLDAWFEMVSSLTTTGATLYDASGRLDPTLHLWRALVGWLGGLLILVAGVAVLAPMNLGGVEVISGRAPGGGGGAQRINDPAERIRRQVLAVFPIYTAFTVILWAGLTMAGDSGFVALCHAMATLSASGISPVGGLAGSGAGWVGEVIVFLFLLLAVTRNLWPKSDMTARTDPLKDDPEFRLALLIVGLVTAVLILRHWLWFLESDLDRSIPQFARATWGAAFTSLSFLTNTGFVSQNWDATRFWSGMQAPGLLLAGLAMMGGGIATTAGGIKLLRLHALIRQGKREIDRQVYPNSVGGAGPDARRMRREGAYLAWIFLVLFGLSIGVTMALLTLAGQEFDAALMFSVAAITNTGPLPLAAGPDAVGYAALGSFAKVILGAAMIVGRIETLAILALIASEKSRG
jgi:trk system potassium uptake protein TrkH